jgi:Rad3-related DNA helicase
MPNDIESKYNHDNKFKWVDSQLEKFMERQKEDAEYIENLEGGVSEMEKRIKELEGELRNIKKYFNIDYDDKDFSDSDDNQIDLFGTI